MLLRRIVVFPSHDRERKCNSIRTMESSNELPKRIPNRTIRNMRSNVGNTTILRNSIHAIHNDGKRRQRNVKTKNTHKNKMKQTQLNITTKIIIATIFLLITISSAMAIPTGSIYYKFDNNEAYLQILLIFIILKASQQQAQHIVRILNMLV